MRELTDEQLGRIWANKFCWYFVEIRAGGPILDEDMHLELISDLHQIDDELERRGLPVDRRYVKAFEHRKKLPGNMERLAAEVWLEKPWTLDHGDD